MFAIPNGGTRNIVEARKLKAEGVLAGVPDLFLPCPIGGYNGLFIELKTERGAASKAQKDLIAKLKEQGYKAEVCKGHKAAIATIQEYLAAPDE